MVDPITVAHSISSAFNLCVSGYILLNDALNLEKDSRISLAELHLEEARFWEWAKAAGLAKGKLDDLLNPLLVQDALEQMSKILCDVDDIKKRCGLDLRPRKSSEVPIAEVVKSISEMTESSIPFPSIISCRASVLRRLKDIRPIQRIRWAAFDKVLFDALIDRLGKFNSRLHSLLPPVYQAMTQSNMEIIRLVVVSLCQNPKVLSDLAVAFSAVHEHNSAKRSAQWKSGAMLQEEIQDSWEISNSSTSLTRRRSETFLHADFNAKGTHQSNKNTLRSLNTHNRSAVALHKDSQSPLAADKKSSASTKTVRKLTPSPSRSPRPNPKPIVRANSKQLKDLKLDLTPSITQEVDSRAVVEYLERYVYLESTQYKKGEKKSKDGAVTLSRAQRLTSLLRAPSPADLRVLHCSGYIDDTANSRYCFIFDIPGNEPAAVSSREPRCRTLLDHFARALPSINNRVQLALHLSRSVLQLHAASWLHKGIRSDNIMFFRHDHSYPISEPYLVGFQDSSPENIRTYHGNPKILNDQEYDLYRHPDRLNEGHCIPFQKKHDIYALGIVLFEIGQWLDFKEFLRREDILTERSPYSDMLGIKDKLLSPARGAMDSLAYMMGEKYRKVVQKCIEGLPVEGGKADIETYFRHVIQPLEQIRI